MMATGISANAGCTANAQNVTAAAIVSPTSATSGQNSNPNTARMTSSVSRQPDGCFSFGGLSLP